MQTSNNKLFFICLCFFAFLHSISTSYAQNSHQDIKHIGIIMPIEHRALYEIIGGFQDTLKTLYKEQVKIKIANAQGDINLQRSIITQMRDANYSLIVPIATSVTQMTASIVNTTPIVGLAADMKDRKNNMVIVNDEIDKEKIIAFIHKLYPDLKHLTLIYSASDKIFPEVEQIKNASKRYHLNLHQFMIQNLAELYSTSKAIPDNTEAIFILKDNLVVSGIETLIQLSKKRKIPLITSDDGTVQKGADLAVGVHEKDIGVEGATLAAKILYGTPPNELATVKLTKPTIFVNLQSLNNKGQNIETIKIIAKKMNYPLEIIK